MNRRRFAIEICLYCFLGFLLVSCQAENNPPDPVELTIGPSPTESSTPTTTVTPTASEIQVWIAGDLPSEAAAQVSLPEQAHRVDEADQAIARLEIGRQNVISEWVYALVSPFPTINDSVSGQEIQNAWKGYPLATYSDAPLLVDENTHAVFTALWGAPAENAVLVIATDKLLEFAWSHQPAWAIVPFEQLDPLWKAIEVDGRSPLRKEFTPGGYALTVPLSLDGDPAALQMLRSDKALLPPSNRDAGKLTTVLVTGVTAVVRGTIQVMESRGILYPAKDIRDILRNADITHISNEVAFYPKCHPNNPAEQDLIFCTPAEYIALLEDIGTDVVELTGDHFSDHVEEWGFKPILYTIEQYKQRHWLYYGGGANSEEARQPVLFEHNGNKIAFIGCNGKGRGWARANEKTPGAVGCDFPRLFKDIADLRRRGYQPIVTYQHLEYDTTVANPAAIPDFRGAAEAGAVVVSGSQGHEPQAMEFMDGSFIHYGLGNLFFDQYENGPDFRKAFMDRHVFYDGRYIGTELLVISFTDNAHSLPATSEERSELLSRVFKVSDWKLAIPGLITPTVTDTPIPSFTPTPSITFTFTPSSTPTPSVTLTQSPTQTFTVLPPTAVTGPLVPATAEP